MLFLQLIVLFSCLSAVFGAAIPNRRSLRRRCGSQSTTTIVSDSPRTTTTEAAVTTPTATTTKTTEETSVTSTTTTSSSSKPSKTNIISSTLNGWPFSSSPSKAKSDFGVSGGFRASYIGQVDGDGDGDGDGGDGGPGLIANYPAGSYAGSKPPGPGIAGFIFEAKGGVDIDNAKEAVVNYKVMFQDGFDFALAGKLPGFYGGDDDSVAKTCAGGHHDDRCWSARLMWREQGKGELYAYLPTSNQHLAVCKGKCDVKYGASIGTGKWKFTPGEWTLVTERVKLNDVGKSNGEIEILVEGESKVLVTGLQLRSTEQGRIRGLMVHTFFGGSSLTAYASPKDQKSFFKDFNVDITQHL